MAVAGIDLERLIPFHTLFDETQKQALAFVTLMRFSEVKRVLGSMGVRDLNPKMGVVLERAFGVRLEKELGRYKRLGIGKSSEVFAAGDLAIKVLKPEGTRHYRLEDIYRQECLLLGRSLPHVTVGKRGYLSPDRSICALMMTRLKGYQPFEDYPFESLSYSQCRTIAKQTAEALEALHHHGVIHSDLHKSNIYLRTHPTIDVQIIDFSHATQARHTGDFTTDFALYQTLLMFIFKEKVLPLSPLSDPNWTRIIASL